TRHIYFDSDTRTGSRSFQFSPRPKVLRSITVATTRDGKLSLADDRGESVTRSMSSGRPQTVPTEGKQAATRVTVTFTSRAPWRRTPGWTLSLDNISYSDLASNTPTTTPTSFVLTVSRLGTGSGTVTSSPAGINCGTDCWESFASGATV